MFKQSIFSDRRVKSIIIIIIVCMVSIPFFIYSISYELDLEYPRSHARGRSGDTIEFIIILELEGGNFDRIINIEILDTIGDWEISPKYNPIVITPDSSMNIVIKCTIPQNALEGEEYFIEYDFKSDFDSGTQQLRVTVDNSEEHDTLIVGGAGRLTVGGSDFGLSPLVFIPEAIIVVNVILLFLLINNNRNKTDQNDQL